MRLSAALIVVAMLPLQPSAPAPVVKRNAIELPRVEGRIDHLAVDLTSNWLFVAALGNNTVEVLDLTKGTHLRSVTGFREPQGIAYTSDLKLLAVANGNSGAFDILSGDDLQRARSVALGGDADNVRYDAAARRFYVGYASGALGVIDPIEGRLLAHVALQGHPESFQLEPSGTRVFVNVPTGRHIAVVDRSSMKLTSTWPVTGAEANYPMALDDANHRLFIGCRRSPKVLIYDTTAGRQVGSTDICGDTDDLFYDTARKRLYVSCGEGFIDVLQQPDPDHLTRMARVPTAAGARTALFVPQQNALYLAVPHRGPQHAEIQVYETRE